MATPIRVIVGRAAPAIEPQAEEPLPCKPADKCPHGVYRREYCTLCPEFVGYSEPIKKGRQVKAATVLGTESPDIYECPCLGVGCRQCKPYTVAYRRRSTLSHSRRMFVEIKTDSNGQPIRPQVRMREPYTLEAHQFRLAEEFQFQQPIKSVPSIPDRPVRMWLSTGVNPRKTWYNPANIPPPLTGNSIATAYYRWLQRLRPSKGNAASNQDSYRTCRRYTVQIGRVLFRGETYISIPCERKTVSNIAIPRQLVFYWDSPVGDPTGRDPNPWEPGPRQLPELAFRVKGSGQGKGSSGPRTRWHGSRERTAPGEMLNVRATQPRRATRRELIDLFRHIAEPFGPLVEITKRPLWRLREEASWHRHTDDFLKTVKHPYEPFELAYPFCERPLASRWPYVWVASIRSWHTVHNSALGLEFTERTLADARRSYLISQPELAALWGCSDRTVWTRLQGMRCACRVCLAARMPEFHRHLYELILKTISPTWGSEIGNLDQKKKQRRQDKLQKLKFDFEKWDESWGYWDKAE